MKVIQLALLAFLLPLNLVAATIPVLPGGSIQDAVNSAAAGDSVVIFGGTYPQNVTIDRSISLLPIAGETVFISGTVTVTGVASLTIADMQVETLTITDVTSVNLQNYVGTTLNLNGSTTADIKQSSLQTVSQNAGTLTFYDSNAVTFNTAAAAEKTVIFRSEISGTVDWNSAVAWFAYSKANKLSYNATQGKLRIVGSDLGARYLAIAIGGTDNDLTVYNNIINHSSYEAAIRVSSPSVRGIIANNSIGNTYNVDGYGVSSSSTDLKILNNIFRNFSHSVSGPFGMSVENNLHWSVNTQVSGGTTQINPISADPLFIDGDPRTLQPESPCHNAGVESLIYANRDGTRNTIGPTGGPFYDPEGWTTENPVMLGFDLGPEVMLEGAGNTVEISGGQAISQP